MSHGKIVLLSIAAAIIIFVGFGVWNRAQPGKYDGFAQCLADEGAIFYGAFWCPHCQEQKAMFGNSEDLLPYQECSTPSGQDQLAVCDEAGVTGYPTWKFANGTTLSGTQTLATLSAQTNCTLPE